MGEHEHYWSEQSEGHAQIISSIGRLSAPCAWRLIALSLSCVPMELEQWVVAIDGPIPKAAEHPRCGVT